CQLEQARSPGPPRCLWRRVPRAVLCRRPGRRPRRHEQDSTAGREPKPMTVATLLARWRRLSATHRRWVYVNAVLISGGVNLFIGGSIAWLMAHDGRHVPLWAVPAISRPI